MSKAHVCQFVFEKNVTHVHVSGTPVDPTGAVAANIAGKYTCSCGAFELGAAQHIGSAVTEADINTAMDATGISEPPHWSEPTDPHAILVRELSTMMKELGVASSPAFARLTAELLPA